MYQEELDAIVANATGEDLRTIRRRGFGILNHTEFITEENRPQVIDWDSDPSSQLTCFMDEFTVT